MLTVQVEPLSDEQILTILSGVAQRENLQAARCVLGAERAVQRSPEDGKRSAVETYRLALGSNSSALARMALLFAPPAASTFPLDSNVAV
jgi:hypothetical protein